MSEYGVVWEKKQFKREYGIKNRKHNFGDNNV